MKLSGLYQRARRFDLGDFIWNSIWIAFVIGLLFGFDVFEVVEDMVDAITLRIEAYEPGSIVITELKAPRFGDMPAGLETPDDLRRDCIVKILDSSTVQIINCP